MHGHHYYHHQITITLDESAMAFIEKLFASRNTKTNKLLKEIRNKMSDFTDALGAFQAEQAALLANIDNQIQQLVDAVNAGDTNAADLQTGLAAITAATQAAKDANAKLTADDSPVVVAGDTA